MRTRRQLRLQIVCRSRRTGDFVSRVASARFFNVRCWFPPRLELRLQPAVRESRRRQKVMSEEKAGWRERLAVRFHLLRCRHCRRYRAQLRAIGAAARNLWGPLPIFFLVHLLGEVDADTISSIMPSWGSERVHIRQVLVEEQEEFYRPSGKTGSPKPGLSVRACHKSRHPLRA